MKNYDVVSGAGLAGLQCARRNVCANIVWENLRTENPKFLLNYTGGKFCARLTTRLWMRRIIRTFTNQRLLEPGHRFLRGSLGSAFAKHFFFGRGLFPDVQTVGQLSVNSYQLSKDSKN